MSRSHISYSEQELDVLKVALGEFVLNSHHAANLLDGQIRARVQSDKMTATVDQYRKQADAAANMVERMKQGFTGLREAE
jgi:hypothetical protein